MTGKPGLGDARAGLGRRRLLQAGAAVATGLAMPRIARAAPPVLRYATGGGIGPNEMETVVFLDWMKQNVLRQIDKTYSLEMTFTRGSPEAASLLAAGQVDMGMLAFSTFAITTVKGAVPAGLTIVGDGYQDGRPGYTSNTFFVLKDSPIDGPAALKGRKIGINAFGSAVDLALRVWLKSHGLDPKRDVQVVEIAFGNMAAALREKRIDCGVLVLPFKATEEAKGDLRGLFTGGDALGPHAVTLKVVNNSYAQAQRDAVRGFLADYITGLKWFYDPANRERALELTTDFTKQPKAALDGYFMTPRDYYRDPNGCLTVAAVQSPIDAMAREGLLDGMVDVRAHLDLAFLPNACPAA
jgi:NitT/TauT family transport system substrate-binding protein